MTTRVGQKGQVVIPKPLRDRFGIQPGVEVVFVPEDDGGGARGARWPVGASRGHRLRERLELPLSMGQ